MAVATKTRKTQVADQEGAVPADLVDRLRLIRTENVGPVTYRSLIARFGNASRALQEIASLSRRGGRRAPLRVASREDAERELDRAASQGARAIALGTPDYPSALEEIPDAPPILYLLGATPILDRPSVAIVGARNASAAGMRFARDLAQDLGEAGLAVASGLARGIDTAAHNGALKTGTIAVMAGGLDRVYPEQNAPLLEQVIADGCALSEMPPGTTPRAQHFPRRNRIVAGISRVVVVVEGAARSGSLITARLAGEQGREVLAVPGSPLDPRARGPNALLRDGAGLCESADDVLAAIGPSAAPARLTSYQTETAEPSSQIDDEPAPADARDRVLERLSVVPVELNDIARLCALAPATLSAIILELELAGRAQRLPGHRVQLVH